MPEDQVRLQTRFINRYGCIRNEKVDPNEDNVLAITTDGRKLALDGRVLRAGGDFPHSKINALVRNVVRIWNATAEKRGTQLVFCDMGVNPSPFSAYDEIVEKLVAHGISPGQIAVVGDADTDAKKQALFEKMRQGHGACPAGLYLQDGYRHERPEATGGPPSFRRTVEARRG